MGLCASSRTMDWYSAVGMLVRLASSCRRVSTDLSLLAFFGLGIVLSSCWVRRDDSTTNCPFYGTTSKVDPSKRR